MPIAEPSTPAPTYATSASSSSPCTVPSSPYVPCNTGKITSSEPSSCVIDDGVVATATVGASSSSFSRRGSPVAPASIFSDCARQRPCLSMPINTGSKRVRSSAASTLRADRMETSCSAERPPNRITTRVRPAMSVDQSQLREKKAPFVGQLINHLSQRLAGAVAGLALETQQHRPAGRSLPAAARSSCARASDRRACRTPPCESAPPDRRRRP